ncbi:MAG TPA: cation-transporting P-type ATPase, partial [Fimbriiglobus sp.]
MPPAGLSPNEIERNRLAHGSNVLTPPPRDPWWRLYLEKFDDPVIRILLVAAAVSVAVGVAEGHFAEGVGIVVAVLLATGLAFWNEFRAGQEFDLLTQTDDDVPVTVIRGGAFTNVPRKDVVVGDVAQVEVGDEIPADGRVIEAVNLSVREARLTGESRPVEKGPNAGDGTAAYPGNVVLRGSTIADGYGVIEVTAVGDGTEIGQTARAAAERTGGESPLDRQLAALSKVIGVVGLGVALLTFLALVVRGVADGDLELSAGGWLVAAAAGVGVAVGLIRVWLPIGLDGLELLGRAKTPPAWLTARGARPWVNSLGLGLALAGVIIAAGILSGLVPANPRHWIPLSAAQEFLTAFMVAVTLVVVAV